MTQGRNDVGSAAVARAFRRAAASGCVPLGAYAACVTAYLVGLTLAALTPPRRARAAVARALPRFDLVIPAHDEATTLPRLLASISALDYPKELLRVHVVADNCTDATAALARAAGATVHERRSADRIGKGYALELGIAEVLATDGERDDGVVVVDADSDLSANFVRALASRLRCGARAVQAYYSVRNAEDSPVAMLRYTALCLYNYLRLRGRARLGLSAGLRGNGMCFTREALRDVGWTSFGLAEDVEQHFRLLERGIRVWFADDAVVSAEMPVSPRVAAAQNSRWERGRLTALRADVPRFLSLALRRGDIAALDAAIEQAVAPLSVCLVAAAMTAGLGAAARSRAWTVAGLACVVGQAFYVVAGLGLARAPVSAYRSLACVPAYALWKTWVWSRAVARPPAVWRRTDRLGEPRAGGRRR